MKVKILLLAANPKSTSNLRLSEEFREIKESIQLSQYRDSFEIYQGDAVRVKDLRRLILDKAPHIVHFSGHGEVNGILLENDGGDSHPVRGEILEELFSLFDSINCVILNSCYSLAQAEYLRSVVPYIIGMNKSIADKSSINFSVGFYDAIASNRSVEDAFKFGVNAIKVWNANERHGRSLDVRNNMDIEESDIPVLMKGHMSRALPVFVPLEREEKSITKEEKKDKSYKKQAIAASMAFAGIVGGVIISNLHNPIILSVFTSETNAGNAKNISAIEKSIHISILDNAQEAYCNLVDKGMTNAYAIGKVLYPLYPRIEAEEKEKTNPYWDRVNFDELIRDNSSLYIIHASAFNNKNDPKDNEKIKPISKALDVKHKHQKLFELLDFINSKQPEAKFLIYSRSFVQKNNDGEEYLKEVIKRYPQLFGKIFVFEFLPLDSKNEVCWTQENLNNLRRQVEKILEK